MSSKFTTTKQQGFQMKFPNGYGISVQFGPDSYGDNYGDNYAPLRAWQSNLAEFAITCPDRTLLRLPTGDTMAGYQTPTQVADWIAYAVALPNWQPNVKGPDKHGAEYDADGFLTTPSEPDVEVDQ